MTDKLPSRITEVAPDADSRARPIVLRDVVMQGHVALVRPGGREASAPQTRPQAPSLVPVQTGHRAEAVPVPSAAASESQMQAAVARAEEEARRKGHEEGLAKGLAEGRERAVEDAHKALLQAEQKLTRELNERAERLTQELRQQSEAAVQARVQALASLIEALPSQIEARLSAAEDDMLALSFETVCRLLGETAARPEFVRMQLAQAMTRLRSRRLVAIHLHPDDLAALQKAQGETAAGLPGGDEVQWIASAEVALGGCILQSPEGGLDARFETQLQALRDLLLQSRASARHQDR